MEYNSFALLFMFYVHNVQGATIQCTVNCQKTASGSNSLSSLSSGGGGLMSAPVIGGPSDGAMDMVDPSVSSPDQPNFGDEIGKTQQLRRLPSRLPPHIQACLEGKGSNCGRYARLNTEANRRRFLFGGGSKSKSKTRSRSKTRSKSKDGAPSSQPKGRAGKSISDKINSIVDNLVNSLDKPIQTISSGLTNDAVLAEVNVGGSGSTQIKNQRLPSRQKQVMRRTKYRKASTSSSAAQKKILQALQGSSLSGNAPGISSQTSSSTGPGKSFRRPPRRKSSGKSPFGSDQTRNTPSKNINTQAKVSISGIVNIGGQVTSQNAKSFSSVSPRIKTASPGLVSGSTSNVVSSITKQPTYLSLSVGGSSTSKNLGGAGQSKQGVGPAKKVASSASTSGVVGTFVNPSSASMAGPYMNAGSGAGSNMNAASMTGPNMNVGPVAGPNMNAASMAGPGAGPNMNAASMAGPGAGTNMNAASMTGSGAGTNMNAASMAGSGAGTNMNAGTRAAPGAGPNMNAASMAGSGTGFSMKTASSGPSVKTSQGSSSTGPIQGTFALKNNGQIKSVDKHNEDGSKGMNQDDSKGFNQDKVKTIQIEIETKQVELSQPEMKQIEISKPEKTQTDDSKTTTQKIKSKHHEEDGSMGKNQDDSKGQNQDGSKKQDKSKQQTKQQNIPSYVTSSAVSGQSQVGTGGQNIPIMQSTGSSSLGSQGSPSQVSPNVGPQLRSGPVLQQNINPANVQSIITRTPVQNINMLNRNLISNINPQQVPGKKSQHVSSSGKYVPQQTLPSQSIPTPNQFGPATNKIKGGRQKLAFLTSGFGPQSSTSDQGCSCPQVPQKTQPQVIQATAKLALVGDRSVLIAKVPKAKIIDSDGKGSYNLEFPNLIIQPTLTETIASPSELFGMNLDKGAGSSGDSDILVVAMLPKGSTLGSDMLKSSAVQISQSIDKQSIDILKPFAAQSSQSLNKQSMLKTSAAQSSQSVDMQSTKSQPKDSTKTQKTDGKVSVDTSKDDGKLKVKIQADNVKYSTAESIKNTLDKIKSDKISVDTSKDDGKLKIKIKAEDSQKLQTKSNVKNIRDKTGKNDIVDQMAPAVTLTKPRVADVYLGQQITSDDQLANEPVQPDLTIPETKVKSKVSGRRVKVEKSRDDNKLKYKIKTETGKGDQKAKTEIKLTVDQSNGLKPDIKVKVKKQFPGYKSVSAEQSIRDPSIIAALSISKPTITKAGPNRKTDVRIKKEEDGDQYKKTKRIRTKQEEDRSLKASLQASSSAIAQQQKAADAIKALRALQVSQSARTTHVRKQKPSLPDTTFEMPLQTGNLNALSKKLSKQIKGLPELSKVSRDNDEAKSRAISAAISKGVLKSSAISKASAGKQTKVPNLEALCLIYLGAFIDSIGYAPFPGQCHKLVQCFYLGGKLQAVARDCPAGMFWDQTMLLCRPPGDVLCFEDKCLVHGTLHYRRSGGCNCFYKCVDGISVPSCCPKGYRYDDDRECLPTSLLDVCDDECETPSILNRQIVQTSCPSLPDPMNRYGYLAPQYGGLRIRACPAGTVYSEAQCRCKSNNGNGKNVGSMRKRYRQCSAEFKVNFDDGFKDISKGGLAFDHHHIFLRNGKAVFSGNSKMYIWGFQSRYLGKTFAIRMKVKVNRGAGRRRPEPIISNCGPNGDSSVEIAAYKGKIIFKAKTSDNPDVVYFNEDYDDDKWTDITYYYDGNHFGGSCNGRTFKLRSGGNLESRDNPLAIGLCAGQNGFHGEIDEMEIYTACIPKDM